MSNTEEIKLVVKERAILKKYDGDPPRYEAGEKIPLLERMKARLTGEILTKEPVEVIESIEEHLLTKEEIFQKYGVKV